MDDDWDLHAVVRGCAAVTTTSSAAQTPTSTQECNFPAAAAAPCFQDLFEPSRRENLAQNQLHDLYKPFFPDCSSRNIVFSPQSMPINSPVTVLGGALRDPPSEPPPPPPPLQIVKPLPPPQTQLRQIQQPFSVSNVSKANVSHNPTSRSKKRKNHMKKVCHVAAENLSSDVWSWRKYGQKPIKGSPYPRGYYRCSTSKGCMARKQVERNRSDPGMFIVTYTAEHNHPMPTHRNSLAGSSRQKPPETASDEPNKASCSPEMSPAASLSPVPEKLESSREAEEEEDDDFSVSNMALEDDFFVGLEDFTAADGGDECDSGHFAAAVGDFPWLSSSATTIAGGG